MGDRAATRSAATFALGAAMVLPPLAWNGAFGWSVVATAVLWLVALALALLVGGARARFESVMGVALVAAFVFTAVQATPLPVASTDLISPDATAAARSTAELLGAESPRLVALSLDPGGTRERTLASLAIAAAFLAGAIHGQRGRRGVLRLALLSVAGVVSVTIAHVLADAEAIYGLREVRYASSLVPSPLVNPNHLGGFCAFGAVLALGVAADAERAGERASAITLAVVASGLVFASLSRGAIVSLAASAVAFASLYALRERGGHRRGSGARSLLVFGGVVVMLTTAAFVGLDAIGAELSSDEFEKLEVQRRAFGMALASHPMLGVGRGAFHAALAPALDPAERYVHPESFVVQWTSEWGVPFAAFLVAAILVSLGRIFRRTRSASRLAGACALAALGLQNLVDFGLEMVGEAVVVSAVFGALLCERERSRSSEAIGGAAEGRRRAPDLRALGAFTLATGAVGLVLLGPSVVRGGALELESRMHDALASGDHATVRELYAYAAPLHPLDPTFPLLAGVEAVMARDRSAPRLLNRAMELAPSWPAPHSVAARLLASRGRVDQAAIELRAAEELLPGSAVRGACELLRGQAVPGLAERTLPRSRAEANRFADALARCLPLDSAAGAALDARLLAEAPELAAPAVRSARRALGARDPEGALALLEPLASRHRTDAGFVLAHATALAAAGRGADGIRVLERAADVEGDGQPRLLEELALAHARAGHAEGVARVVGRLVALAAGSPVPLARAALVEGRAEELLGRPHAALRAYRRADGYDPSSGALERAARLAQRNGHTAQSYQLYSTLCRRSGPGSPACARRLELRGPDGAERLP